MAKFGTVLGITQRCSDVQNVPVGTLRPCSVISYLKPVNKIPRLVRIATAVIVAGGLAVMYAKGEGVPQDDPEAVRWYRLAAEQGQADAQYGLGVYATGRGVLKDSVLAHMWSNIASANGDEAARKQRDNLEDDMTRAEISRATELARTCMPSDYQDCEP